MEYLLSQLGLQNAATTSLQRDNALSVDGCSEYDIKQSHDESPDIP